ncbi:glycosyltransferase family 8 protein [Brachyspira murdochii]|uniref:Glycosyl transferase family 8 n=1 Tax=Brachyspira murdochii (strain ATCC 51284 / DSM 12563 / 56-150) TaxID=526224 RepID=D5U7X6_BRAM5|nr:glycosyltransferase family 8 protein [Brachyspira murdochii]ADG70799.1 glycosyl transferase family 8 [Brachyspira murdochii DSM 12563]
MQDYNICLCSDENYAKYMAVTMASILKNTNDDENIIFHIIESNIKDETKNKLIYLKKIKNCEIKFYRVEYNKYPLATYLRLLIPELIKDADKVLYLDSDIIVNGSLKELFDIDINGYYALAVKDLYVDIYKEHKELIEIGNNRIYFNAGVVLFNNKSCIDNNISQKFYSYFTENKNKLKFHDQDILNHCFIDKVKIIDRKWNFMPFRDYNTKSHYPTKDDAVIIHFVEHKPWKTQKDRTYFLDDYWRYYQYTPWFFEEPITAIQTMMQQKMYDYEDIRFRSNYFKFFGIYANSSKLQIVIFGIRITIDAVDYRNILKIAWWIPIKKWREAFKNKFR